MDNTQTATCEEIFRMDTCQGTVGCLWNAGNFACTGSATECSSLDVETCASQDGCTLG